MSRTSAPPISTLPASTSHRRETRLAIVDLPEPEAPTSAVTRPASARNETPRSVFSVSSAFAPFPYPKTTSRSSTVDPFGAMGAVGSVRVGASHTSPTLAAICC